MERRIERNYNWYIIYIPLEKLEIVLTISILQNALHCPSVSFVLKLYCYFMIDDFHNWKKIQLPVSIPPHKQYITKV